MWLHVVCGWSPAGRTAKFSKTTLEAVVEHSILWQQLVDIPAVSMPIALETSVALSHFSVLLLSPEQGAPV